MEVHDNPVLVGGFLNAAEWGREGWWWLRDAEKELRMPKNRRMWFCLMETTVADRRGKGSQKAEERLAVGCKGEGLGEAVAGHRDL